MKRFFILSVYYLLFPIFLLICLPSYLLKMKRRGAAGTGVLERFGIYQKKGDESYRAGLYIHAVSVGECFIALKVIRKWQETHDEPVVLALSTPTGHQVAREAGLDRLRVIYAPLDVPGLPERVLSRFAPRVVALIEAELWPHFAEVAQRRNISLVMLNARLSPRSESRYLKLRWLTEVLFSRLNALGAQNQCDAKRFAGIGVAEDIIQVTGSIKFDVLGDQECSPREEFITILKNLSLGKAIVLAASTHAGEERLIAEAIREAGAFPLIVPRHAERRADLMRDLHDAGFKACLRTETRAELLDATQCDCYVADTTGELREWTCLSDLVVIGKSFLARGGQNPAEAIAAAVPVIIGSDMSNFADLITLLEERGGITRADKDSLAFCIKKLLGDKKLREKQTQAALRSLKEHESATLRSVQLIESFWGGARSSQA